MEMPLPTEPYEYTVVPDGNTYLALPLPFDQFTELPETISVLDTLLAKRPEFHVTIGCLTHILSDIPNPEAEAKFIAIFNEYVKDTPIQFESYTNDFRFVTRDERRSLVVGCMLSNIEGLYQLWEKELDATINRQPTHVTIYSLTARGIGISAPGEWDALPQVTVPEVAEALHLPTEETLPEFGVKRENEERRDGGCAVVFDPATQRYAVGDRPTDGLLLLFSGGIEAGEDMEDAIYREVKEESGLYDFQHVEKIGEALAHYHNSAKNVNRVARVTGTLMILKTASVVPVQHEAHENFTLAWVTAEEILNNWAERDETIGLGHWIYFFKQSLSRAIELGYDSTTNPILGK